MLLRSSSSGSTLPVDGGAEEFPEIKADFFSSVLQVDGEEEDAEMLVVKQPPPTSTISFKLDTITRSASCPWPSPSLTASSPW